MGTLLATLSCFTSPQTAPTNDARKSIGWNVSGYGDGFRTLKKENIVKGHRCNPAKDPSMVKLVFSLEYKDEKLLIVELTLGKCDLILL